MWSAIYTKFLEKAFQNVHNIFVSGTMLPVVYPAYLFLLSKHSADVAFLWTRHASQRFWQRNNTVVSRGKEKERSSSNIMDDWHKEVDWTANGSCSEISSRSRSLAWTCDDHRRTIAPPCATGLKTERSVSIDLTNIERKRKTSATWTTKYSYKPLYS